jgi:hypothetical protein
MDFSTIRLVSLTALLLLVFGPEVGAIPIDGLKVPVEITCRRDEACGASVLSNASLGGRLGVAVTGVKNEGIEVKIERQANSSAFSAVIPGGSRGSLLLTWDGDPYPQILSSAGLGCLNLTGDGSSVLRVLSFAISGCSGVESLGSCTPIIVETRIYHPGDPTGQRYSASVLKRTVPREVSDLDVPFSNFIQEGPRGRGDMRCVGALSILFKFETESDLVFTLNGIETDGEGSFEDLFAPTALPNVLPTELPTVQPTLVATSEPLLTPVAEPSPTPQAIPTPRSTVGSQVTPMAINAIPMTVTAISSASPSVVPTRKASPTKVADPPEESVDSAEERTYGSVVAEPSEAQPTPRRRGGMRLWD